MYCPRCGQEQASENTRFCSRCGFLLETVAEVLANGGVLPQLLELKERKTLLTKKNGIVFSAFWFIFFVLILVPFFGILGIKELAGMSAIIGVFGALMWLIASFVWLKKPSANFFQELPARHQNLSDATQNVLPSPQSQPVESYVSPVRNWKTPPTGEVVSPPSVIEETTKLLQKDE